MRAPPSQENLLPKVVLDQQHCAEDAIIVKEGSRLCGAGAALGNAPLAQSKSYWEIKVQMTGSWGVGVAARLVFR